MPRVKAMPISPTRAGGGSVMFKVPEDVTPSTENISGLLVEEKILFLAISIFQSRLGNTI